MKITGVESFMVYVPYTRGEQWAWGEKFGSNPLIIKVHTDAGLVGLGEIEAPFAPPVLQKIIEEHILPHIVGQSPFDLEKILANIMSSGLGWVLSASTQAIAGIEMALWDLMGKAVNKPVYKLLGGKFREKVPYALYLYGGELEVMKQDAVEAVQKGAKTIKIKVGIDQKGDIEKIRSLREAVGPDVNFVLDANQAWTPGTAIKMINKLSEFDIKFIEQPTKKDDFDGMRRVREAVDVPIAADESISSPMTAYEIIRNQAADVFLIDVETAGGISACKKIAGLAELVGIPCMGHSRGELGIGTAAMLHVIASTPNFIFDNDTYRYYQKEDIITNPFQFDEDFCIAVPEGPGLGVELDEAKIEQYLTKSVSSPFSVSTEPRLGAARM